MKLKGNRSESLNRSSTSRRSGQSASSKATKANAAQLERIQNNADNRKAKLENDELVEILSPSMVNCLLCDTNIKLSDKSDYDNFHWENHRRRCVQADKLKSGPPMKKRKVQTPGQGVRAEPQPQAESSASSNSSPSPMSLPQLTESEDELVPSVSSEEVNSPIAVEQNTTSPHIFVPTICGSQETYQYIRRMHPDCPHQSPFVPIANADDWSWSQLKSPLFRLSEVRNVLEDDDDDGWFSSHAGPSSERLHSYGSFEPRPHFRQLD